MKLLKKSAIFEFTATLTFAEASEIETALYDAIARCRHKKMVDTADTLQTLYNDLFMQLLQNDPDDPHL